MILYKSNLIFGIIKAIFQACFNVIYKVLSLLCLQGVVLVGVLGLILYLTGVFAGNETLLVIYYVVLGFTVIISLSILIRKYFIK